MQAFSSHAGEQEKSNQKSPWLSRDSGLCELDYLWLLHIYSFLPFCFDIILNSY
jgi:hypothetical protein